MQSDMKLIDTTLLAAVLAVAPPMILPAQSANAESDHKQMGINANGEVDVIKAEVTGNEMTIILMFQNTAGERKEYDLDTAGTHYFDKGANKKHFMLRDTEKKWVASNVKYNSKSSGFQFAINENGKKLIWMKFPAPAAGIESIDLSIPGVLPFDGLKVSR